MTTNSEKVPHVHAKDIKAWADGAKIECRTKGSAAEWKDCKSPIWSPLCDYRVKPEPKPDVVRYAQVYAHKSQYFEDGFCVSINGNELAPGGNLKLTIDGETGKLKSAEAI